MSIIHNIVQEHFANPFLTNGDIARMANMSERQLYRFMEETEGISPNRYLRECRLDRAVEMLHSGNYDTVKEVALRVGFRKVSYFTDIYAAREGERPSSVLRQHR